MGNSKSVGTFHGGYKTGIGAPPKMGTSGVQPGSSTVPGGATLLAGRVVSPLMGKMKGMHGQMETKGGASSKKIC